MDPETAVALDRSARDPRPEPAIGAGGMRALVGFALFAGIVAIAYTVFTDHVWEDYFITFRHSQNLAEGHGLVFTPGERVHGFTSPLGTLLPALCFLVTGGGSHVPALWLFRFLSILGYTGAGLLVLRTLQTDGVSQRLEGLFFGLLYVLNVTILDFSINGMETGFLVLFAAWGYQLAVRGLPGRWLPLGLCWAGLMWTRPDGFVHIIALSAAAMAFPPGKATRREMFPALFKAAALCTVVYLPWFAWAWWYYGSPVPHTVIAKSLVEISPSTQFKIIIKESLDRYFDIAAKCFLPNFYSPRANDWHPGLVLVSHALAIFGACYWMLPTRERAGRIASLAFAIMCLYFTAIPMLYDWYLPPATMLGLVAVSRGVWTLAAEVRERCPRSGRVALVILSLICVERSVFFVRDAYRLRVQQQEIENNTRMQIGLWLKDHIRPGDRVFCEPLGYIGYFSGAIMRDWPGLVAPDVVRLRHEQKCTFVTIIPELKPEWMVLRDYESSLMTKESPYFRAHYTPAITFDARPRLAQYHWLPGRSYLDNDATFTVFQRTSP